LFCSLYVFGATRSGTCEISGFSLAGVVENTW
jgi:hypothetical protein